MGSDNKRLKEIVSVFIKYGIKDGIKSINNPVQIRLAIEELGPTFIKIGQILSTRPDILPESFIKEFKKLQDDVICEDYTTIRKIIEEGMGKPLEEVFSKFDPKPMACASMAVVHKAVLKNGESVVVKIQRPGAREVMSRDIGILRKLARLAKYTPQGNVMNVYEVVDELWEAAKKEMDFLNEAENIEKFIKNNSEVKFISCPKVYREYTRYNILVLEYIRGIKIDNIDYLEKEGYDLEDIAEKLTANYFKQVFEDGFFHADPHPGNIFVYNGKITYIDFGLMGVLGKNIREKFNEFLYGAATRNIDAMMYSLLKIGVKKGSVDTRRLYSDIEGIYNTYIDASLSDIDLPQLLDEVFKTCRKNNISMPRDITLLLKGIVTIEGVAAKISPDLNIMSIAIPFIKDMMLKKRNLKQDMVEQLENLYLLSKSGLKIPIRMLELINSAVAGKLKLQMEHINLEKYMGDLNKMVNRLTFGLIVSSLIIGSALFVSVDAGPKIFDIPAFGLIGFIFAVVMGAWLLISVLRSGKM